MPRPYPNEGRFPSFMARSGNCNVGAHPRFTHAGSEGGVESGAGRVGGGATAGGEGARWAEADAGADVAPGASREGGRALGEGDGLASSVRVSPRASRASVT